MARITKDTVLADRYRLIEKLGEGSMGSVWQAEHLTLGSPVAVKILDESIARSEVALARFMREARAAASLKSVHVVQIHDYGVDRDVPYITMELLHGETLGTRLNRLGHLAPPETALILTHVARAIGRAHDAGVIHRDLKPDNIFIVREEDEEYAKVLDFGVAKAGEGHFAATLTSAGKLLGTPAYMSAEQAAGRPVDHRTDLWALAVIAFECLTGTLPFIGDDLPDLLHAIHDGPIPVPSRLGRVPPGFDAWFARGVARPVRDRFHSAREMAAELRQLCGLDGQGSPSADALATVARRRHSEDLDPDPESTGTRIANAMMTDEDEAEPASSSNTFDDIIRTQDILDEFARPADDLLTEEDFDDETSGGRGAIPAESSTAAPPRQPPTRRGPPPKPEQAPRREAVAMEATADCATTATRSAPPPTSEPRPTARTLTSVAVPDHHSSVGLLVKAGVAVVLITLVAVIGYAYSRGGELAPAAGSRAAGAPPPSPAPLVSTSASAAFTVDSRPAVGPWTTQ